MAADSPSCVDVKEVNRRMRSPSVKHFTLEAFWDHAFARIAQRARRAVATHRYKQIGPERFRPSPSFVHAAANDRR
ncbi:MAG: hypothetical protein CL908_12485 [Deltaproteobacteria bacterium]|nr:hypothetical protein [Deltaproteobacteria bacterium]